MPGHYLWYRDGKVETTRYWEARFNPDESLTEEQAVDEIEKVFEESVNAHKISDVEVGCFLSSGVDSSYVSTYFADQKTFTVGFDFGEKYNENQLGGTAEQKDRRGAPHSSDFLRGILGQCGARSIPYGSAFGRPILHRSVFCFQAGQRIRQGRAFRRGRDELFGGYTIYNEPHVFKAYQKILPSKFRLWLAKEVKKLPHFKGQSFIIRGSRETEEKFIGNAFMYDDEDKRRILKDPSIVTRPQSLCKKFYDRVRGYDQETKMQYLDINLWMVGDILLKADRMSMANSLELRVPFLDKEVFKVASKLPTRLRVNKRIPNTLCGRLPTGICLRKPPRRKSLASRFPPECG